MEIEKDLAKKLEKLETDYIQEKRRIEETTEDIHQEKRVFQRELEQLSEYIRYISNQEKNADTNSLRQAYYSIEQAQDEGQQVVKKTLLKIEDELEEQQFSYKKQKDFYEEEITLLRKER